MPVDVYFKSDVRDILAGLLVVIIESHVANGYKNPAHLAGALTLARGLVVALGLSWSVVLEQARGDLGAGYAGLLDRGMLTG